ncbi:MAG: hypothetical protein ABW154_13490 [Dyella sp.]
MVRKDGRTGRYAAMVFAGTFAGAAAQAATVIPTVFEAGHIYATPTLANGKQLRMLVDTGGGGAWTYWLKASRARQMGLKEVAACNLDGPIDMLQLPLYQGTGLPVPAGPCHGVSRVSDEEAGSSGYDGQMGGRYLSVLGVWTFDYPGQRLIWEARSWRAPVTAQRARFGFAYVPKGLSQGFPRLTIIVDGQSLDMLLDTGATSHPTTAMRAASGEPVVNGEGVTSYITTSILERWHRQHPDWRVIDRGDDLFGVKQATRTIRVPRIQWAGYSMGPVWFTERSDQDFHAALDGLMDKPPVGALGGNVFRHFVMRIDYPRKTAWLRCADAVFCQALRSVRPRVVR